MNLILKYNLILIGFMFFINISYGQKVDIEFKINGLAHKEVIIAHYFGENTLIDDTIKLNDDGKGKFASDSLMQKGLYLFIFPDKTYFEFIIDDDQVFKIETDTGRSAQDYIENMKIKGSDINQLFSNYQLFMIDKNNKSNKIRQKLKEDPTQQALKNELDQMNIEVKAKWDEIKTNYKGTFLEKMVTALEDVDVPEPPKDENGIITDSLFQYNYYKDHYFENFDFIDNQLLYSPVYHRKLNYFYERIVIRRPDSVIAATDNLLSHFSDTSEYFQYTLAYVFNKYAQSKYMGFDAVVVHLAEQYYLNGKADWVSESYLKKLRERVEKLKPNLLGAVAPRLDKAQSIDGYFYPLHDVKAKYTVVAFYEPSCGHCKKELPALNEEVFIKLHKYDVQIYAFYTQSDKNEWSKFIEDKDLAGLIHVWDPNNFTNFRNKYDVYSTPTVFLLDENKRIIAKRVDVDTIVSIINEKEK